jgi:hypothetical protein
MTRKYENAFLPTSRKRVHLTLDLIATDAAGVLAEALHRGNAQVVSLALASLALSAPAPTPGIEGAPKTTPRTAKAKAEAKATTVRKPRTTKPKATTVVAPIATPVVPEANLSAQIKDVARAMFKNVLAVPGIHGQGQSIARPFYGKVLKAETLDQARAIAEEAVITAEIAVLVAAAESDSMDEANAEAF